VLALILALALAAPGDHDRSLEIGGATRTYLVHLPPRVRERGPLPVVLAFHGGGGNARGFQAYAGLDAVADREGFVVVYPDGSGRLGRRLLTWNAGTCCGYAHDANVDDVAFSLALLRDLARELPLDLARVYATGHSNGAMLAYRLAVEAPERIAAIAPVAGMMVTDRFPPARPVPVLHIHSVDDPRALYAGGLGPPFPFTNARVAHRAVEPELARWVAHDRCAAAPQVAKRRSAAAKGSGVAHTATLLVWGPCAGGAEVRLWKLTGAGHGWPGSRAQLPEKILGPDTTVIDAATEVWRFLQRWRR
jgi:polyhydroxybutyrate depolymerase